MSRSVATVQITMTGQNVDHVQVERQERCPMTKCYTPTPSSAQRLAKALVPARTRSIHRIGERTNRIVKELA